MTVLYRTDDKTYRTYLVIDSEGEIVIRMQPAIICGWNVIDAYRSDAWEGYTAEEICDWRIYSQGGWKIETVTQPIMNLVAKHVGHERRPHHLPD